MALTFSTSTWENYVNKQKDFQSALVAGKFLKFYHIKVTFGAADNYVTNGVAADLGASVISDAIICAIPITNSIGVNAVYDATNKKIKMYGQTPTSATTGTIGFDELANASTLTQSATFEFLVIGV